MSAIVIDPTFMIVPFDFCLKYFDFLGNFGYDNPIVELDDKIAYIVEKTEELYGTPEWREMLDILMEEWEIDYDEGMYLNACNNLKEYNDFARTLTRLMDNKEVVVKKNIRQRTIKIVLSI